MSVTVPAVLDVAAVRDYMMLEANNPIGTSRYTPATIGSNIRAAFGYLEKATRRFFADRPATSLVFTTEGRASLYIPGIRTPTTVTWQGGPLTFSTPPAANTGAGWFLPDIQQTGLFTGFQLRVYQSWNQGGRPWLANPQWFDTAMDSPYHPANRGGGYSYSSLPNDLVIAGDWGYADADLPDALLHAWKVLASWYTQRPAALLANSVVTPAGGIIEYSHLPVEVGDFITEWRLGEMAVGVG